MNEDNSVPLVVSYESNLDTNVTAQFFRDTLNQHKWEYKFIGNGEKWNGFMTKIFAYRSFLQKLNRDKIIVLSDARDVICCRSPCSFMNSILPIINDNKIIVSAELFLQGHINWTPEKMQKDFAGFTIIIYNGKI